MDEIAERIEHLLAELRDLRIEAEAYLEEPHEGCGAICPIELMIEDANEQILTYCHFLSWLRRMTEAA